MQWVIFGGRPEWQEPHAPAACSNKLFHRSFNPSHPVLKFKAYWSAKTQKHRVAIWMKLLQTYFIEEKVNSEILCLFILLDKKTHLRCTGFMGCFRSPCIPSLFLAYSHPCAPSIHWLFAPLLSHFDTQRVSSDPPETLIETLGRPVASGQRDRKDEEGCAVEERMSPFFQYGHLRTVRANLCHVKGKFYTPLSTFPSLFSS